MRNIQYHQLFDPRITSYNVCYTKLLRIAGLDGGVAGLRVAVAEGFYLDGVDAEMRRAVTAAAATLARLGASYNFV